RMTASALTANCASLLGKLIRRLGSNHPGEVLATVAAIKRTLASDGRDLHDLAQMVDAPAIVPEVTAPHPEFSYRAMRNGARGMALICCRLAKPTSSKRCCAGEANRLSGRQRGCLIFTIASAARGNS